MKKRRSYAVLVPWLAGAVFALAGCGVSLDSENSTARSQEVAAIAASQADSDGVAFDPGSMPAASPNPLPAFADDKETPDPVPEEPRPSDLALVLQEFAQFPASEPFPPTVDPRLGRHARINFLTELQDGSGRMFTPDLNGTLYVIRPHGTPEPFLDVKSMFPNFFSGRGLGSGF